MVMQVFVAHTGETFGADPVSFASFDAFRSWVAQNTGVSSPNQILMTARGKQVKLQTLLTEKEIFVYDRQYISPPNKASNPTIPQLDVPAPYKPKDPPDTLSDQNSLRAWQDLFQARRVWALDVVDRCTPVANAVQKHLSEMDVIQRSVNVAVENLQSHIRGLEQKQNDAQAWTNEVVQDQEGAVSGWESTLDRLDRISVKPELAEFLKQADSKMESGTKATKSPSPDPPTTLSNLLSMDEVNRAGSTSKKVVQDLKQKISDISKNVANIVGTTQQLMETIEKDNLSSTLQQNEEPKFLMEDIARVARKVDDDYEHVMTLVASPKSVSQASKMALLHTRNHLPSLAELAVELAQLHCSSIERKNQLMQAAIEHMQKVSSIQSMLANINPQLSSLDIGAEGVAALDLLSLMDRLPFVYGSVLVEAVRRREWAERMKGDSSALAEELAALGEEEERRRKKWQRNVGDIIRTGLTEGNILAVEVNLRGDEQPWPVITREDVAAYLESLKEIDPSNNVTKELAQAVKELDRPTRHQAKRAKAFKMGSLHEAALGKSSIMLPSEEARSLKEDKAKLEERLKGSESRVRKLEDLLHRHTHVQRTSSGNVFQLSTNSNPPGSPAGNAPSPRPYDTDSRRSSISSRRFSANQLGDEKALVQKVISLEAELIAERERVSGLEKEASARKQAESAMRNRAEEADHIKKDLMQNLDATQREFADERRNLEEHIVKLTRKLEETEDELDHVIGSRDHERQGVDERVRVLEADLEALRKDTDIELNKAQAQVDAFKADFDTQKERADSLQVELEKRTAQQSDLKSQVTDLQDRLQDKEHITVEQQKALHIAHNYLAANVEAPDDIILLAEAIEDLSEKAANEKKSLQIALSLAQADIENLRQERNGVEAQISELKEKLGNEEMESFTLRETLAEERARFSSLQREMDDERLQLSTLRAQLADGETGSESLKERVAQEEQKVTEAFERLAASEARVTATETQLESSRKQIQQLQDRSNKTQSTLESRSIRAKDLTQRLYAQNDRLGRLLRSLGFTYSRRDGVMVIERVSRTSSSTTEADPTSSMHRTISGSMPPAPAESFTNTDDLDLLYWMHESDSDAEQEKYSAYISTLGAFDIDAFSEAIIKRLKETEHMARKWQKEARAYRDKSHRAQSEAHEKIAFRSFKEGDLALFLPTRNQATRPWAAFNVGAPHYFLREQESHKLRARDWLLARISKVEERMVDLSKSMNGIPQGDERSFKSTSDGGASFDDENPFELSDGLRWYLLDAAEEKPGAPSTPGLGKSTVASANIDAKGSIRMKKPPTSGVISRTLSRSLDSRRSSSNSKKGLPATISPAHGVVAQDQSAPGPSEAPSGLDSTGLGIISNDTLPVSISENQPEGRLSRATSPSKVGRPSTPLKQSVTNTWDSFWSVDVSLESGQHKR